MKLVILLAVVSLSILRVSACAQTTSDSNHSMSMQQDENMKYCCPMHPDEMSNMPGKCSKCGMDMTKCKKTKMDKYSCPMHADVTGKKHDKCSKCGMELTRTKKDEMNMDQSMSYACPMHPDQKCNMPGKCGKCGMDLQAVKH